ncbi:MAG: PIG-L deacetylase family protein [Promethearchaeota archaeon]
MESKTMNVLAIFAHPDDLTYFSAGTIAKWAEQGYNISTLCCTRGEVGSLRIEIKKEEVAALREKELRTANKILGVKETIILDFPDGGLMDSSKLRERLVYYVRKFKADRVVTLDPWATYEVHPDHLIVGRMAAEAGTFAMFPLLYPEQIKEGLEPYHCSDIWFMGLLGHQPNCFVDISSTLEKKIQAALKFEATLELIARLFSPDISPYHITPDDMKKLSKNAGKLLRSIATTIGRRVDLQAAEAFYTQKVLPGHFDNIQQQMMEMLGNPPERPKIY